MTGSRGSVHDVDSSWLFFFTQCFAPLSTCLDSKPRLSKSQSAGTITWPKGQTSDQDLLIRQDDEKSSVTLVCDQPAFQLRPMAVPATDSRQALGRERKFSKSTGSGRTSFSVRSRFRSDASSRRPQISEPSDFRHLDATSFRFPDLMNQMPPQQTQPRLARTTRRASFRPLELSIYMPNTQLSPLLPEFDLSTIVSQPPRAHLSETSMNGGELVHQKSYSSMSFHIPRKTTARTSPSIPAEEVAPRIPPRHQGRARAYTSPDIEVIKERVATAMIEVEQLQKQIDRVMERQRQSLYSISRPTTPQSIARTMPELESMPSIPAIPPAAPSFAERLNSEIPRPHTAPMKSPVRIPHRHKTFNEASSAFANAIPYHLDDGPPPPPLPLVLRPPLRKKKSFSRVSTWLFPNEAEHSRELSIGSITNAPRPVKGTEGFYQCVPGVSGADRRSFDTMNSISTWDSDDEDHTVPTAWSPDSTPLTKRNENGLERTATFGQASEVARDTIAEVVA